MSLQKGRVVQGVAGDVIDDEVSESSRVVLSNNTAPVKGVDLGGQDVGFALDVPHRCDFALELVPSVVHGRVNGDADDPFGAVVRGGRRRSRH